MIKEEKEKDAMFKGAIFDLDGTLISEREYILGCLKNAGGYIERTYGTQNAYPELKKLLEIRWEKVFDRYFDQEKIHYDETDIEKLLWVYRKTEPATVLYPDVAVTLKRLKEAGMKLALLTNGYYEIQKKKIEKADLERYFDLILIPDEYGREFWKPAQWGYNLFLHRYDLHPEEVVVIGDMDHDFTTPAALGMNCVYIERADRMKELSPPIKPDRKIYSLIEIGAE